MINYSLTSYILIQVDVQDRFQDSCAMSDDVWQNRLRRMADRQGLRLVKSRRRDPLALDYGTYQLLDSTGAVLAQSKNLADIERVLTRQ